VFRAHVAPGFTQHHSDVADMTQTQAFAIHSKGFAAVGRWDTGAPGPGITLTGHMRHQVFDGLAFDGFLCPSNSKDQAPGPIGILSIPLHDYLHIIFRAISGIAFHDYGLRPRGGLCPYASS
jgi:hypothetical protein